MPVESPSSYQGLGDPVVNSKFFGFAEGSAILIQCAGTIADLMGGGGGCKATPYLEILMGIAGKGALGIFEPLHAHLGLPQCKSAPTKVHHGSQATIPLVRPVSGLDCVFEENHRRAGFCFIEGGLPKTQSSSQQPYPRHL